jgi:anti-anti-sigma factor
MLISSSKKGNLLIVAVEGRIDSVTAPELEEWIAENLAPPSSDVVLDCSHLDYISSAGLRVMLNISKTVTKASYTFSIACVQDHVREVFEISGFDSFIPIHDSVADVFP